MLLQKDVPTPCRPVIGIEQCHVRKRVNWTRIYILALRYVFVYAPEIEPSGSRFCECAKMVFLTLTGLVTVTAQCHSRCCEPDADLRGRQSDSSFPGSLIWGINVRSDYGVERMRSPMAEARIGCMQCHILRL
jgi:hypothetical protein